MSFICGEGKPSHAPSRLRKRVLNLFVMDADGSNVVRLTTDATGGRHPAWSR
jgi:Tol biopolymer transport system component